MVIITLLIICFYYIILEMCDSDAKTEDLTNMFDAHYKELMHEKIYTDFTEGHLYE